MIRGAIVALCLCASAGCGDDDAAGGDAGSFDAGPGMGVDAGVTDAGCDAQIRMVSPRVSEVGCGPVGCRIGTEACCVRAAAPGTACGSETFECVALGAASTGCETYLECDPRDRSGSCPPAMYCCRERTGPTHAACVSDTACATGDFVCHQDADCPVDRPRCAPVDAGVDGLCMP